MRLFIFLLTSIFFSSTAIAQIDPALLRRTAKDTSGLLLNMDAVYNRPFLQLGKLPVALGGYAEANYQYLQEDGITEGHQFQMRRLTLFVSSSISKRIGFMMLRIYGEIVEISMLLALMSPSWLLSS